MKRTSYSFGLIFVLVLLASFIGFLIGLAVMRTADAEKIAGLESSIPVEKAPDVKVTNVYFPKREIVKGEVPRNSYNPEGFGVRDGYMSYYNDDNEKISKMGIDISYHQENIDWEKLKLSPVEFVMARVGYRGYTEGGLLEDEKFDEYASMCNENDIPLGVYFFSQAISEEEAIEEADYVINKIKDYKISYPVCFDTEDVSDTQARTNKAGIDKEERTKFCIAFCERIKAAGYYPMIYASENWIRRDLVYEDLQEYDFWAPYYRSENDFLYDFTIWQYSDSGNVPGVSGEVDLNVCMVDYAEFVPALREAVLSKGEVSEYDPENIDVAGLLNQQDVTNVLPGAISIDEKKPEKAEENDSENKSEDKPVAGE